MRLPTFCRHFLSRVQVISLLKVKDCFQDNSHKDILFSRHMQTFSRLFFHYNDVCEHMFYTKSIFYEISLKPLVS